MDLTELQGFRAHSRKAADPVPVRVFLRGVHMLPPVPAWVLHRYPGILPQPVCVCAEHVRAVPVLDFDRWMSATQHMRGIFSACRGPPRVSTLQCDDTTRHSGLTRSVYFFSPYDRMNTYSSADIPHTVPTVSLQVRAAVDCLRNVNKIKFLISSPVFCCNNWINWLVCSEIPLCFFC